MTYTTSLLAVPLVLAVWVLDVYLTLLLLRGILHHVASRRASELSSLLMRFTDPPNRIIKRWLGRFSAKAINPWLPWLAVVLTGLIVRHLLVVLIGVVG